MSPDIFKYGHSGDMGYFSFLWFGKSQWRFPLHTVEKRSGGILVSNLHHILSLNQMVFQIVFLNSPCMGLHIPAYCLNTRLVAYLFLIYFIWSNLFILSYTLFLSFSVVQIMCRNIHPLLESIFYVCAKVLHLAFCFGCLLIAVSITLIRRCGLASSVYVMFF